MTLYYFHRFLVACSAIFFLGLSVYFYNLDKLQSVEPTIRRPLGALIISLGLFGYLFYYHKTLKKQKQIIEQNR